MAETTPTPAAGGKSCSSCGVNLDAKPNYKIGSGKYLCPDCMEKAKAAKFAMNAKNAPAARASGAQAPSEDNSFLLGMGSKTAIAETGTKPCPECGRALTADAVICTGCGFNTDSGKRTRVRILKPEKAKDDGPAKPKAPLTQNPHAQGLAVIAVFGFMGVATIQSPAWTPVFFVCWAVLNFVMFVVSAYKSAQVYETPLAYLIAFVPVWRDYVMLFKQESVFLRWCWAAMYINYIFGGIVVAGMQAKNGA